MNYILLYCYCAAILSAEPPVHPAGGSVRRVATRLTGKNFSAAIEGSEGGHGRLLTDIPPVKRPLKNGEDDDSREGNTGGIRARDIWTRGILVSDKSFFDQRGQGNSFGHDIAGMTNDWICPNPQNAPEMRRWSHLTCTCTAGVGSGEAFGWTGWMWKLAYILGVWKLQTGAKRPCEQLDLHQLLKTKLVSWPHAPTLHIRRQMFKLDQSDCPHQVEACKSRVFRFAHVFCQNVIELIEHFGVSISCRTLRQRHDTGWRAKDRLQLPCFQLWDCWLSATLPDVVKSWMMLNEWVWVRKTSVLATPLKT